VSTVDQAITEQSSSPAPGSWTLGISEPTIELEFALAEAEALRAWLLKPAADGATSLEDPLVSRVLSRLGLEVDGARSAVNVRRELVQAGISVDHLSDEKIRELGSRIAAMKPGPTDQKPPVAPADAPPDE
jgi:hypothetical protein